MRNYCINYAKFEFDIILVYQKTLKLAFVARFFKYKITF